MTAKAWETNGKAARTVDEVFFQNDAVSLCLLVHRRAKTMRVVDFRAGPSRAKRMLVLSLARREDVEKVYTLVERDEVSTWIKLGFAKEGSIPGFYKRSDAFLLGRTVPPTGDDDTQHPRDSEVRIAIGGDGDGHELSSPAESEAHIRAEKTLVQAKKLAKELLGRALPSAKVAPASDADVKKAIAATLRSGRALTTFEPFGRDVEREHVVVTSRGGFELYASIESQACFGNAFLELLTAPRSDAEKTATVAAVGALVARLVAQGVVSCFSLVPSDDVRLAAAFAAHGFRRTGLLQNHVVVGGERKDAILFSRKLANPADD